MRIIFILIMIWAGGHLSAQEYSPHVKIETQGDGYISWTSGTIINTTGSTDIITCAHSTIDSPNVTDVQVYLFYNQKSAKVKFKIQKKSLEHDLILLRSNIIYKVSPIDISDKTYDENTNGVGYGYPSNTFVLKENKVTKFNYKEYHTFPNHYPILLVNGEVFDAMSGGGLLVDNVLVGVQSAGNKNKNEVHYTPGDQIIKFIDGE
jgi:hypothetical protein